MSQSGPCVICGATNYALSMGGPTICPSCDCGNFGMPALQRQTQVINSLRSDVAARDAEIDRLNKLLNTPLIVDWFEGVRVEAAHQVERWGSDHDAGKTPLDWFWLIGFLAQKAATSALSGDSEKAKHHTISTGAAMFNWFRALSGDDSRMRPGIEPPGGEA